MFFKMTVFNFSTYINGLTHTTLILK